jgi:hypothetical protein
MTQHSSLFDRRNKYVWILFYTFLLFVAFAPFSHAQENEISPDSATLNTAPLPITSDPGVEAILPEIDLPAADPVSLGLAPDPANANDAAVPQEAILLESAPSVPVQDNAAPPNNEASQAAQSAEEVVLPSKIVINPSTMSSVLFTYWEHTAIKEAKRARGSVRAPSAEELARDLKSNGEELEKVKPPPEERDIKLGGIVFNSEKDWTIWLNGERITPNAVPEEVLDLRVFSEYIELKWFDDYTNQIFPIRLRTNQRFNIDSRIFLPG